MSITYSVIVKGSISDAVTAAVDHGFNFEPLPFQSVWNGSSIGTVTFCGTGQAQAQAVKNLVTWLGETAGPVFPPGALLYYRLPDAEA